MGWGLLPWQLSNEVKTANLCLDPFSNWFFLFWGVLFFCFAPNGIVDYLKKSYRKKAVCVDFYRYFLLAAFMHSGFPFPVYHSKSIFLDLSSLGSRVPERNPYFSMCASISILDRVCFMCWKIQYCSKWNLNINLAFFWQHKLRRCLE